MFSAGVDLTQSINTEVLVVFAQEMSIAYATIESFVVVGMGGIGRFCCCNSYHLRAA